MDNVSCEKRHKNGRYCQKTRQYLVMSPAMNKYVCELHLVPVLDFIAPHATQQTVHVRKLF